MKFIPNISFLLFILILLGCAKKQTTLGEMKFPEGTIKHAIKTNEINWKPCPPNIPGDCEMAVLEGNPKNNELFTVRFKIKGDFVMPSHQHPKDERVTILKGKVYVAFGKKATKVMAKEFGAGDYYVNARNEIHSVWADNGTIIQITGIGPWETNFVKN